MERLQREGGEWEMEIQREIESAGLGGDIQTRVYNSGRQKASKGEGYTVRVNGEESIQREIQRARDKGERDTTSERKGGERYSESRERERERERERVWRDTERGGEGERYNER